MRLSQARYVTACQQFLALGAAAAVLVPAAAVLSLEVVGGPEGAPVDSGSGALQATPEALVEKAPVTPTVRSLALDPVRRTVDHTLARGLAVALAQGGHTAPDGADHASGTDLDAGEVADVATRTSDVTGFGAVGITWAHGADVHEGDITIRTRWLTDGTWSAWEAMPYHEEDAPDPDSAEGRKARPGTDAFVLGDVDQVQVQVVTPEGDAPDGLQMDVVDAGASHGRQVARPAIDTGADDAPATATAEPAASSVEGAPAADGDAATAGGAADAISLEKAVYTPKPQVFSRAQWGANESLRDKSALRYASVSGGFVHHTVNANDYSADEVPAMLRSIYAYHTQSRGWSDIGYNFIVDRFGRLWEGRYGGADRPVVGAHTLNYNDYSFAVSALGNYETTKPSEAMVDAIGRLMAWKLSLHGVSAAGRNTKVGATTFAYSINGHRDAGQTACPGKYLYTRLGDIRAIAAAAQKGWDGRELESDLVGARYPDLAARRASDGRVVLFQTGGLSGLSSPTSVAGDWAGKKVVASPDLTGDGKADVVTLTDSLAQVHPGDGAGRFGERVRSVDDFVGYDLVTAVGDLDGDGRNDLVGRAQSSGALVLFRGDGSGRFTRASTGVDVSSANLLVGAGDLTGDGRADVVWRDTAGVLRIQPGTGGNRLGDARRISGTFKSATAIAGYGDWNRDGKADLLLRTSKGAFIYPGKGNGQLGKALGPLSTLSGLTEVSGGGNLTGSSAPDLLARKGGALVVVRNTGGYDLLPALVTNVDASGASQVLRAGDWDRDGFGDLVLRYPDGRLVLRAGKGDGTFEEPVVLSSSFSGVGLLSAVGDMTGDGWPDLMGQPSGGSMRVYPGRGASGVKPSYVMSGRLSGTRQLGMGRWTGDGAPDNLVTTTSGVVVYAGNGPGGIRSSTTSKLDLGAYDWVLAVRDLRMSGRADLVVRQKSTNRLYAIRGGNSGWSAPRLLGEGMGGYDLAG